jgi:prohibitin 2
LYRIPEGSVVKLFTEYWGDPFKSLIAPRVQEALKEVASLDSAEQIVKNREQVKARTLELARQKVGSLLVIEDVVIENISLTKELEGAIEAKMVQEQDAAKAKYVQQRAQIDADTGVIKAKGEAESIRIRGEALKEDPSVVDLKIVDKWDGVAPLVIGGGSTVYQLEDLEKLRQTQNAGNPSTSASGR